MTSCSFYDVPIVVPIVLFFHDKPYRLAVLVCLWRIDGCDTDYFVFEAISFSSCDSKYLLDRVGVFARSQIFELLWNICLELQRILRKKASDSGLAIETTNISVCGKSFAATSVSHLEQIVGGGSCL